MILKILQDYYLVNPLKQSMTYDVERAWMNFRFLPIFLNKIVTDQTYLDAIGNIIEINTKCYQIE